MSASEHLQPRQFFDVPDVFEGPERPLGLPFRGGDTRTLPPEHHLLSTQDWLDTRNVRELRDDDEAREVADDEGLPRVSRYRGSDWIFDGHHRIAADRLAGRPTRVLYHTGEDDR